MTARTNLGGSYGVVASANVDAEAEYHAFDALPQPIRERLNRSTFKILASTVAPFYRGLIVNGLSEDEAVAKVIDAIDATERAAAAA